MKNPSFSQCLSHLEAGGEVWAERISDNDFDIYESKDSFTEMWDCDEDYEEDAEEQKFMLK